MGECQCVAVSQQSKRSLIKCTFIKSIFVVEITETWTGIGDDGRRAGDGGEEEG
jgi:hypothetical protein